MATRYERVVLDLEDRFTGPTLRAAAAAQVLDKSLNDVSGDSVKTQRSIDRTTTSVSRSGTESDRASRSIDKYSGRLGLLADVATSLGPALVPIGAVGIPAFTGLASQMGFAALAAGTLVGSMQGVGDAVKKLEAARVAPTDASIEAARVAMSKLSEDGQKFARTIQDFLPALREIRDAGGEGWFPGLTKALKELEQLGPQAADIFEKIGRTGGHLAALGAKSLTSDRWQPFFDFIEHEAPRAMKDFASTVGDLTHGLAELWMAFTPLNNNFSSWMVDAANSFDQWATGLSKTQGFTEFVDYVRTNGPLVADALGSIANAILQIVEAAAPLGGPTLRIIASLADTLAQIADSDLGTPLVALASLTSAMRLLGRTTDTLAPKFTSAGASVRTFGADLKAASAFGYTTRTEMERSAAATGRLSGQFKTFGKNAAVIGGVTVAASGLGDSMGMTNAASMSLLGTMLAPGWGTAAGFLVGSAMDVAHANDDLTESFKALQAQIDAGLADPSSADTSGLDKQLADAKAKLDEYKDSLTGFGWTDGSLSPAGLKNSFEGLFGSSDIEEAQAKYDEAARSLSRLQEVKAAASRDTGMYRLYQLETEAIDQNIEAINARRDALANSLNAELGYKGSILDAQDALKTNGKTVDENTRAGQANLQALYSMASSYAQFATQTDQTEKQVESARKKFVAMAVAMGMGEDKARRLSKQLYDIPTDIPVNFHYTDDDLLGHLQALNRELRSIDGPHLINIGVGRLPNLSGFGAQIGSFDTGGYTGRGGKYEPAGVVHRREFVFSSEATDGNEAFLSSLHRSLRGYATGGYVGPMPARAQAVMSSSRHTERIVERLPRTIVLRSDALGDVVIDTVDSRIHAHDRRESVVDGQ